MQIRVVVLLSMVLFALSVVFAGGEKKYGKSLTLKRTTKISEILAHPEKFNGKKVLVEGKIVDVCSKAGCWIKIAGEKESDVIQFKVDDGVIVFPVTEKGKLATAEGKVFAKKSTKEELIEAGKREAAEQGKQFDPSGITGPQTVVRINGEGAVVK
ncbi:MAG: DUF4920 domain-containing protein [Ignavibacteriales bacterium]|nr:DUF4920 domain-containing protein [Ignavibacteriales bacterium]